MLHETFVFSLQFLLQLIAIGAAVIITIIDQICRSDSGDIFISKRRFERAVHIVIAGDGERADYAGYIIAKFSPDSIDRYRRILDYVVQYRGYDVILRYAALLKQRSHANRMHQHRLGIVA